MDREEKLIGLYTRVYSRQRTLAILRLLGALGVVYVVLCFLLPVAWLLTEREYAECLKLCSVAAIPFAAVSLMRSFLNVQRPYEVIDFAPFLRMRKERKAGKSFPSRHVFSAFLIGTLVLFYSVPLGIVTLLVGAFIAAERVMLGIHFTRDVIYGGIIGIASGLVGIPFL